MSIATTSPLIGVLAIQGAVEEHVNCVTRVGGRCREIKWPSDMDGLDGIILPGGESTAMAIVGENCGLFPALKEWVKLGKPVSEHKTYCIIDLGQNL